MLGDIVDNDTVNNKTFMDDYVGQKFVDIAGILGSNPNHQSNSIYRAGGRGGFPLLHISSDFLDTTNTADDRYLEISETIADLFSVSGVAKGDTIYGTFGVRMEGSGFFGVWSGLTATQMGNGSYTVHITRTTPNYEEGTIPSFDTGVLTDSSTFEVYFESISPSESGMAGNTVVFGVPGSGAQYTNWSSMIDDIYPNLDATSRYTIFVMPGEYDVTEWDWERKDLIDPDTGLPDRAYWGKVYVPPFVDVVGLDKSSVWFKHDSTDYGYTVVNASYDTEISDACPSPGIFLASQQTSINNLNIHVQSGSQEFNGSINTGYAFGDSEFPRSPITFMVDGSTDLITGLGTGNPRAYGDEISTDDPYIPNVGAIWNPEIFSATNVHFLLTGEAARNFSVFNSGWRANPSTVLDHFPPTLRDGIVDANFVARFNNCSIKDSLYGRTRFEAEYDTIFWGETFYSDYLNLEVNQLYYEQSFEKPYSGTDSTTWPYNISTAGFVVAYQGFPSFPVTKRFNDCVFKTKSRFILDDTKSDSTSLAGNFWSYPQTTLVNQEALNQSLGRPALLNIIGTLQETDKLENEHVTEFNNCRVIVDGMNHPQKGDEARICGADDFISEFCVGIDNPGHSVYFNDCKFVNTIDSPYSGIMSLGSFNASGLSSAPSNIGSVYLNSCVGESYGMGFHRVPVRPLGVTNNSFYINLSLLGGSYSTYKSPMLISTKGTSQIFGDYYQDAVRFSAKNTNFSFIPYHMGVVMTSANEDSTQNNLPLWVDSTTVMGYFYFDSTGDEFSFENCAFTTKDYSLFDGPEDFDNYSTMTDDNDKFGAWICVGTGSATDSTAFTPRYHKVIDCKFSSGLLKPFIQNPNSVGKAPVVVDDCVFAYGSSSDVDNAVYPVGPASSDSKYGSYYTRSYPNKAVNDDFSD